MDKVNTVEKCSAATAPRDKVELSRRAFALQSLRFSFLLLSAGCFCVYFLSLIYGKDRFKAAVVNSCLGDSSCCHGTVYTFPPRQPSSFSFSYLSENDLR